MSTGIPARNIDPGVLRRLGPRQAGRGGARTIYFLQGEAATIYLLTADAKAEREDLTGRT